MGIQSRLQMIMRMNNLNASQFADKIGVQRSSISHIISGRNKPSLDFIQKTLEHFPRVNADWLITGKVRDESSLLPSTVLEQEVKDEPRATYYSTEKTTVAQGGVTPSIETKPELEKIVWFYTDGTYKIFEQGK